MNDRMSLSKNVHLMSTLFQNKISTHRDFEQFSYIHEWKSLKSYLKSITKNSSCEWFSKYFDIKSLFFYISNVISKTRNILFCWSIKTFDAQSLSKKDISCSWELTSIRIKKHFKSRSRKRNILKKKSSNKTISNN